MHILKNDKGQALAPKTVYMNNDSFKNHHNTEITWLGNASILINSHGTNIMIDPLLEGFDMPLLIEMPILPNNVPHLDGVLVTHIDNDHFSRLTCKDLKDVCDSYHAPHYVASEMDEEGLNGTGHDIYESFKINDVSITLTKAVHNWQNVVKKWAFREWKIEDYCGYRIETTNGTIWLPGDSKLIEEHLNMKEPDVILFDFADNDWHITFEGAVKLANTYPNADLICIHWGCVDAPNMTPFNANPEMLVDRVIRPERIKVLAPGEKYVLGE